MMGRNNSGPAPAEGPSQPIYSAGFAYEDCTPCGPRLREAGTLQGKGGTNGKGAAMTAGTAADFHVDSPNCQVTATANDGGVPLTDFSSGPEKNRNTGETVSLGNADFIEAVFRDLPEGAHPLVISFGGDPDRQKSWPAWPWPAALPAHHNNFFALGSYYPGEDGVVRRRKTHFAALHAVLLDDLGTKASLDRLGGFELSWLIETSPGNFQGGIILDPPLTGAPAATRLLNAIVDAGLCDPGATGPMTRAARLPVGTNTKARLAEPFPHRVAAWRPEARYSAEEIVFALELDMRPAGRPKAEKPHRGAPAAANDQDDVYVPRPDENPVLAALKSRGLYKTALGEARHDVTCPWVTEHTGAIDHGTAYCEPDDGFPLGGFSCLHGSCASRHIRDLLGYLAVPVGDARCKPIIRVIGGEIHRVVERAEAELAGRGRHFQAGGLIVSVATHPETRDPHIHPTSSPALTAELARAATWERYDARSGAWVRIDPPVRHVAVLYDVQRYQHLPPLAGLARQPYFRDDGSLVTSSGYDERSQLFGVFDPREFPVPRNPNRGDAERALDTLLGLLTEFRFAAAHDRSAALSALLTATVRPALPAAPLYLATAPVMASGKSYLCKLITAFAGPGPSAPSSYPADGAEATKALLALLLTSPAVIEFDDMTTDLLPHGAMNRVLTEQRISDRILGETKVVAVSTRATFLASGNNVAPVRDMRRRVITIQIDPRCQTPATISYQHGPVEEVRRHRGRYVAAVLTIIEAWRRAGCARADVPSIATYGGAWADYCRHPLIWLGQPDPATALLEQLKHDPDADVLGRMLSLWVERFGYQAIALRDVLARIAFQDELEDAFREVAEEKGSINRNRLGWWIKRHAGRIVDGFKFCRAESSGSGKRVLWCVLRA